MKNSLTGCTNNERRDGMTNIKPGCIIKEYDLILKERVVIDPDFFSKEFIEAVEETYDAKFVCESEISDVIVALFYTDKKHPVSGSHYFAVYQKPGEYGKNTTYITNGQPVADDSFTGIRANDGEVIYSHYRHHMNTSSDETVWIDGGREYVRCNDPHSLVGLTVDGPELTVLL